MTPQEIAKLKRFMRKFECAAHRMQRRGLRISTGLTIGITRECKYRLEPFAKTITPICLILEGQKQIDRNGYSHTLAAYFGMEAKFFDIAWYCGFLNLTCTAQQMVANRRYFVDEGYGYGKYMYELGLHYANKYLDAEHDCQLPPELTT